MNKNIDNLTNKELASAIYQYGSFFNVLMHLHELFGDIIDPADEIIKVPVMNVIVGEPNGEQLVSKDYQVKSYIAFNSADYKGQAKVIGTVKLKLRVVLGILGYKSFQDFITKEGIQDISSLLCGETSEIINIKLLRLINSDGPGFYGNEKIAPEINRQVKVIKSNYECTKKEGL